MLFEQMNFDVIDAAAARSMLQILAQRVERILGTGGHQFDGSLFGVAHPSAESQLAGDTADKPAEAHALYAARDNVSADHAASIADWPGGLQVEWSADFHFIRRQYGAEYGQVF